MNMTRMTKHGALWAATVVILASSGPLFAQARSRVRFSGVGYFRNVGQSTVRSQFQRYSYGLGALRTPSVGGSVLRSSIHTSPFSTRNSLGSLGPPALRSNIGIGGPLRRTAPTNLGALTSGQLSLPAKRSMLVPGGPRPPAGAVAFPPPSLPGRLGGSPRRPSGLALGGGESYLAAMQRVASQTLRKDAGKITSLVPEGNSPFSQHLARGEQEFRKGQFRKAANAFRLAGYLAPRSPEHLLSMMHAEFAVSRLSYAMTSLYLRRALQHFPELPLAPLQPKALYGDADTYNRHIGYLNKHLQEHPGDADAHLTLAYFRWFEGQTKEAVAALVQAQRHSRDTSDRIDRERRETIDVFRAGMVASGRIPADVKATSQPARSAPAKASGTSPAPATPSAKS